MDTTFWEDVVSKNRRSHPQKVNIQVQVTDTDRLFAPLIFSTLLCKVHYQKIVSFAERCLFFCHKTAWFCIEKEKNRKFSIFNKEKTAIFPMVRGPPSEI